MASGLGKTFTSAFALRAFRRSFADGRVLFLAHQKDLLDQAEVAFRNLFGDSLSYGQIHAFEKNLRQQVTFATFQSMREELTTGKKKRKKRTYGPGYFEYIIVDESHHGHAPTYREVITYFKPKFLLGMTATPDRMDMQDIRDIFGQEVFRLDLEEALSQGLLTPVDYRILADEIVTKEKLDIPPHRISLRGLNRIFFAKKRDSEIVRTVMKRVKEVPDPRVIVFTASIKHADQLEQLLPGSIAIHSGITQGERRRRLDFARSGLSRIVITVDQFNEGVDIPQANVIVFLRSTQSRTVFLQQLGRGLRIFKGKSRVLVLDFVANAERLMFLRQLREELRSTTSHKRGGVRHEFHVDWGNVTFEERAESVANLLERLRVGITPEQLLQYLRHFYERHGRAPQHREFKWANGLPSWEYYERYFQGAADAYSRAGIPPEAFTGPQRGKIHGKMKRKELLKRLKSFIDTHKRAPVHRDFGWNKGLPPMGIYEDVFGSFLSALKLVGGIRLLNSTQAGKLTKLSHSEEERKLIANLRAFLKKNRRVPHVRDFQPALRKQNDLLPFSRFGSFFKTSSIAEVLRNAGIRATLHKTHLSDKELLKQLKVFYRKNKRRPDAKKDLLDKKGMPSVYIYRKRFGSITKAFLLAGIPLEGQHGGYYGSLSDDELLEKLRLFSTKFNRAPLPADMTVENEMPAVSRYNRFGGLNKALLLAKVPSKYLSEAQKSARMRLRKGGRQLKPAHLRSDKELLSDLRRYWQSNRKIPGDRDCNYTNGLHIKEVYVRRFGSFASALRKSKVPNVAIKAWLKEDPRRS